MKTEQEDCVVAVYADLKQARAAIKQLQTQGFPTEKVSLVAHSLEEEEEVHGFVDQGDKTTKDASRGAFLGGLLGLLAGTAFFWIPGFGPLIVLGPLATGLTGGIVGTLVGAMTGWGIPDDHVKQYEAEVRAGRVLVVAHGDPMQVAEADKHLRDHTEPVELHLHAQGGDASPEVDDRP